VEELASNHCATRDPLIFQPGRDSNPFPMLGIGKML
jgi:hypothetical protein